MTTTGDIKHWLDALAEKHARVPDELAMIERARAELRELEDAALIGRFLVKHGQDMTWRLREIVQDCERRKSTELTDEQRAALVKACGETAP